MSHIDHLADMRRNYTRDGLLESQVPNQPFSLFSQWFDDAVNTEQPPVEANAMMLATVDAQGQPHCRVLLLKAADTTGFTFFTNYQSNKGHQLEVNTKAAMTFFWPALERQVRIEGTIEKVSAKESDDYFQVRPLGSRLGAWASPQSRPLKNREELEQLLKDVQLRFADNAPSCPPHWGGYRLKASSIEFWQGRPSRLHDRIIYQLQADASWQQQRLAP